MALSIYKVSFLILQCNDFLLLLIRLSEIGQELTEVQLTTPNVTENILTMSL